MQVNSLSSIPTRLIKTNRTPKASYVEAQKAYLPKNVRDVAPVDFTRNVHIIALVFVIS